MRLETPISPNSKNLLSGITPTFTGWNTSPGTVADIVDELIDTLTTNGVQTNATTSTIVYDLSRSTRFSIFAIRGSVGTSADFAILISEDNITYYTLNSLGASGTNRPLAASGKARYIKLSFASTATGNTISLLKVRAYKL